jgi:hypothetical protein
LFESFIRKLGHIYDEQYEPIFIKPKIKQMIIKGIFPNTIIYECKFRKVLIFKLHPPEKFSKLWNATIV